MIVRQYRNPLVVFQKPDTDDSLAEPAIAVSTDAGGLIILNQEGRDILINRASLPDLIKALKLMPKPQGS